MAAPANFVVERHAARWNIRTTCSIMPTRLRHAALCHDRVRRPISSNECSAIHGPILAGRPDDLSAWTVTDDWPERVPVTSAEVDVFEAWFGDVFDELFGPCQ
jgi:hypothetical protein